MVTIVVRKDVNFKDIEELNKIILENANVTLRIPNSLNTSGAFGIEALILQLIATWLRSDGEHTLHTYIQNPQEVESYTDLYNSLYGICALSLSNKTISTTKEIVSRRYSLLLAADRIKT